MKESNFSEECPHCGESQPIRDRWESRDYASDFVFDCTECSKAIEVHVHYVPEFEASKAMCPLCKQEETQGVYCEPCAARIREIKESAHA